jgi:hypothetical protein
MTLQLSLPADLEGRLRQEAERRGLSPDAVTLKLLDEHLPRPNRQSDLPALLRQWQAEDEVMTEEEIASNVVALRLIDEDRLSNRKLFTDILEDGPA